ncbi:MAG: tetratricopeptide repeat-containing sensor histidine kinase [Flavobacterium sp.]|nr:MAG: tetratricopeptide repeat-containing sensor histidine kinase [Flavobacterium sp.]
MECRRPVCCRGKLNGQYPNIKSIDSVWYLLGNASMDLNRPDEAINFYNQALPFFKGSHFLLEVMNGRATAFQRQGNYAKALPVYDSILTLQPEDQSLLARVIDNRARTKWLSDPAYPALSELHQALKIRTDSQYHAGLNASYAHLADYYAIVNPDSARWYAHQMHEKATGLQSPADILEALDKLIRFDKSPGAKVNWYGAYKKLDDSLQRSRDTTRDRFALIRYDYQKSTLNNLVLQRDLTRHQLLNIGIGLLAILTIGGIYLAYTKRKKRIKEESERTIRTAQLKTSQKVHDVVANGLYGIMNELEHGKEVEREPLITRIESLYEKSRNISYEDAGPIDHTGYDRQVHDLLTAYANEQTKVILVGNQADFWNKVGPQQKQELQLALQELMVNMKKHSQAKNVVIQFKSEHDSGFIDYRDDGLGFTDAPALGNGLNNTVTRIKSLNGAISFGKSDKGGAAIAMSFPFDSH